MSDYRRLISYIYEYEGREKGKNVGFVKLEAKNGQCRLNVNVKKIYMGGNAIGVYLLGKGGQETFLGNMFVRSGNGEFRVTVDAENVEGSGLGLDTYYGLTVHDVKNAWRCYTTIWEDAVMPAMEILPAAPKELTSGVVSNVVREIEKEIAREEERKNGEEEKTAHAAELEADGEWDAEETAENAARAAAPETADVRKSDTGPEPEEESETTAGPYAAEQCADSEPAAVQETQSTGRAVSRPIQCAPPQPENPAAQNETETLDIAETPAATEIPAISETQATAETPYTAKASVAAETPAISEASDTPETPAASEASDTPEASNAAEVPDAPALTPTGESEAGQEDTGQQETVPAMPQHVLSPELENPEVLKYLQETEDVTADPEKLWVELKKSYPKIRPFDYEDGCEVLTIRPQDIGRLPRESWVYGNNSFLLHGYYNFRYLILVRLGGQRKKPRYLIGVPGHYYSNEKYMASMFGFPNFVLSKKQPANDGRFGYWYTDIRVR